MIDLMGNTVWTEAQISRRVVELIRQKYSENDELYLARISLGKLMGTYTPTAEEEAEIEPYQTHVENCRAIAIQAREDNELLRRTIEYEQAVKKLAEPVPDVPATVPGTDADGNETLVPNPVLVIDTEERTAAQAVVDAVTQDVLDLVALRAEAHSIQDTVSEPVAI